MAEWKFRSRTLSEQNRDPTEQEFFRREDAVASLVREAIQNSLDAARGGVPVRVRFLIPGKEAAIPAGSGGEWLRGLAPHLAAVNREKAALLEQPMSFLVVEDFGTRGLRGNHRAANKEELGALPENEDFFYFWRNVGITGKSASERGSWGLGKAVYASSSEIHSVFGWTVRQDSPQSLLMGQCVLKIHTRQDQGGIPVQHDAYGFFGEFGVRKEDPQFAMPVETAAVIRRFREEFHLERSEEPGLSLVIPFPSEELCVSGGEPDQCADQYAREVLRQYAYPILRRQLEVDIVTPAKRLHLDREGVLTTLGEISWEGNEKSLFESFLLLAMWAIDDAKPLLLERSDTLTADWAQISFPGDTLADSKKAYSKGDMVGFRVPVLVRPKGTQVLSSFDVFMLEDPEAKTSVVRFIRQGLTLSEIDIHSGANVVGLVLIEDPALAKLLRDAENPAHTKWLPRADRLKKNFTGGPERVAFVEAAPRVLLKMLLGTDEKVDRELLADFFPDASPDAARRGQVTPSPKPKKGNEPPGTGPIPPPTPRPIRISQIAGGFVITRNPAVPLPSPRLTVHTAFDCISGNPFTAWEPFDFSMDKEPIQAVITGGTVEERIENRLRLQIDSDEFRLEVRGFPENRDIAVRYRWVEVGDGAST